MKKISFTLLFFLAIKSLFSQPLPCEEPPEMTSFCVDACIICDIDGFQGRHDSEVTGEAPSDFCTVIVHNAQWIAFIAGSEDLTIELAVSNCVLGNGLEIAIYEGIDCGNFRMVSNCRGGMNPVPEGTSATFSNTEPLIIGQYYYLVMDGNFGDNCDWVFTVIEGSTQVSPLTTSGLIEGPSTACPDLSSFYSTFGESGATDFDWRLNGTSIGNGEEIEIDWTQDGIYELCVTASNACDEAPPSCRTIIVETNEPTTFDEIICEGETFHLNDTTVLSDAGNYEFHYLDIENCDSTVLVDLEVVGASFTDLAFDICEGDSIFIGGTPFFTSGLHEATLVNYLGCDSLVTLDLGIIICEIQGESEEIPVVCNGESSGTLDFLIENGTPSFAYNWMRLAGPEMGSGMITALNQSEIISDLPAGTYLIEIQDNFGNDLVLIQEITEPEILSANLEASNYNGYNISCFDETDGSLNTEILGGVEPYSFNWSHGDSTAAVSNLEAGNYEVQITDAGGCVIIIESTLNQPNPLILNASFTDPNCDGLETGAIQVQGIAGGVEPYLFGLSQGSLGEVNLFPNLSEGTYTLTLEDANGCTLDTTATLVAPIIPVIDAGETIIINLGEETGLDIFSSVPLDNNVVWENADELSCIDCPNPELLGINSNTYTVNVTSEDGCTTQDSVLVIVQEVRDVYIPNAFSPNDDGVNDQFFLYGGPEVSQINSVMIFSRWGELLYEETDIPVNNSKFAWDGTFNGKDMPIGIYTYVATIEFIDGVIWDYSGDVLIVR